MNIESPQMSDVLSLQGARNNTEMMTDFHGWSVPSALGMGVAQC